MRDQMGQTGRAVVSVVKVTWRAARNGGNISRAVRNIWREVKRDWHALDNNAKTSAVDKLKASADLILGTGLYDTVYDVDDVGKIGNGNPGGVNVGDGEIEKAIGELDRSIAQRKSENDRFPRGNPNGGPEEKRLHQRYKGHAERISREEEIREGLRKRLERLQN